MIGNVQHFLSQIKKTLYWADNTEMLPSYCLLFLWAEYLRGQKQKLAGHIFQMFSE